MNLDEFSAQVEPKAKRSRLEPYFAEIFDLKTRGYANWQIREFLSRNGVDVTVEAVRKFIKRREGKSTLGLQSASPSSKASRGVRPVGGAQAMDAKSVLGDLAKPTGNQFSPLPKASFFEIDESEKGKK